MQVSSGNGTVSKQLRPLLQAKSVRSVSEILDEHFTKEEVGGPSSFGSHHIKDGMSCPRKAYNAQVLNLTPDRPNSMALDLGSLVHAILALHYGTGGVKTWEPYQYVLPELPNVAAEARRLLVPYFERWAQQDAETFDVRAVEYEAIGQLQSSKRKGNKTSPITCRYDTIIAVKEKDAAPAPYGPIESGCLILEHKTARALTKDLTTGYMFDFQLMTQCLMWKLAGLDEVFGPLRGVRINFIVKTKTPQFQRMDVVITDEEIKRFAKSITKPAIDLWHRRQHKDARKANRWPMNMASCIGRFGLCSFFDLCESGGSAIGLYRERTA